MASAAEQARRQLRGDFLLQEVLARDIVDVKGLARWLKDNRGVDGTVDAIAQGIYEFDFEEGPPPLQQARDVLSRTDLDHRNGLAALIVETNGNINQRLSRLVGRVDVASREVLRFIPGEGTVTFVLDEEAFSEARRLFDEDAVVDAVEELDEVRLDTPGEGPNPPGLLDLALMALTVRRIEAQFVTSGYREHHIPVPADKGDEALRTLRELKEV